MKSLARAADDSNINADPDSDWTTSTHSRIAFTPRSLRPVLDILMIHGSRVVVNSLPSVQ
jgi:hypothetical protein